MPYHKTLRKVLFELGHITNPNEYTKIRENISQIAVQIALGLEVNVARYYKKEAYEFNNAFYDTKQAAIKERMRKTDFRGDVINNPIKTVLIGLDSVEGDIYFYANP